MSVAWSAMRRAGALLLLDVDLQPEWLGGDEGGRPVARHHGHLAGHHGPGELGQVERDGVPPGPAPQARRDGFRRLAWRRESTPDLGGSSLQLTRVRRGTIVSTASLPLGAVRTPRRYFRHDPPTPGELRALRQAARDSLAVHVPAARPGEALVGLGGTVRTVARLHLPLRGLARITACRRGAGSGWRG
jgi:hypothetical protein